MTTATTDERTRRITTTHTGSLHRPADLAAMLDALKAGEPVDLDGEGCMSAAPMQM